MTEEIRRENGQQSNDRRNVGANYRQDQKKPPTYEEFLERIEPIVREMDPAVIEGVD